MVIFSFNDTEHTIDVLNEWKQLLPTLEKCQVPEKINLLLKEFKTKISVWSDINDTVELFKQLLLQTNNMNDIFETVKNHKNILSFVDPVLKIVRYFVYHHEIHDVGIFIGRCQLFSRAHEEMFYEMFKSCKIIVYILGSDFETDVDKIHAKYLEGINILYPHEYISYDPAKFAEKKMKHSEQTPLTLNTQIKERTKQNPFTTSERIIMATGFINQTLLTRTYFLPMIDVHNGHLWADIIAKFVFKVFVAQNFALFGFDKDDSSYYLKMFPQFISKIYTEPFFSTDHKKPLSATSLREQLFLTGNIDDSYVSNDVKQIAIKIWEDFNTDTKEFLINSICNCH